MRPGHTRDLFVDTPLEYDPIQQRRDRQRYITFVRTYVRPKLRMNGFARTPFDGQFWAAWRAYSLRMSTLEMALIGCTSGMIHDVYLIQSELKQLAIRIEKCRYKEKSIGC